MNPYQSTGFFSIGASVTKMLTTLNNKFTESEDKENNFSIHVILVWHEYISIFISFLNGWESHSGKFMILQICSQTQKQESQGFQ